MKFISSVWLTQSVSTKYSAKYNIHDIILPAPKELTTATIYLHKIESILVYHPA